MKEEILKDIKKEYIELTLWIVQKTEKWFVHNPGTILKNKTNKTFSFWR